MIRVWTGSEMKRATPRFLARLHGITDDVALPSEERLAKTVIGNGIPLQLVRAVVGPMVQPDGGLRFMREIDPNIDMLPSFKVAGQTVRDALLSTPKNHPYRDIAVAIAEFPIPSMAEDRVGSERSTTLNFYSYDAAFEGQPRINLSMYTKYSTLIHEAVHAFTAESVKRSMLFAIGRRDLAAAEGVDPASLSDDAVFMARRLAKANLIERWELDGLLKAQSEDARQSLLKMALLKRYVKDVKGDANIRTDAGYMAMVEAAIADPKTPVPVKRLLELFVQAKAESDIKATATPNNRLMAPGGWDTVETGEAQSEADAQRMRESLDIAYGLSNPLEFSAMAFSSPPFQRWLNERGGDGRKSLWQRFVAIVSRILGVKNDSMLESVIDASADLSQVRPDSVRFMRERSDSQLAADGMTRLYRVQLRPEFRRELPADDWRSQAMRASGTMDAQGRWFFEDAAQAEFYLEDIGRDRAEIVAVDVPTADLDKYRVSNVQPDGIVNPRRFSARGMADQEFFLPRDLASQARPTGDIRFMRERSDSQLAADHAAAFERGDAEAATAIVREYGRRKGYAYFGYHGSDTEFTEFMHPWERAERDGEDYESDGYDGGNLGTGFYFTPDRHYASKFGVARSFLLRISNPIDSTDPDTMSFLDELEQSMIEDTGDVSPGEVYDAAMDERGADGVIAKDAGGFSFGAVEYMVREPSQIKLADPFTYDKDGKLIPLDKRFDDSTGDIRFMRERPAVASVKRFLSRIAPGSEFADNLATSFVWEYAILDREINRVAKEYGLEDEYRANDMLKVSPGKRAAAMLDFQNMEVRPFEAAAEGLAKRSGMPVDQVLDKIKEYAFYVQSQDAAKVLELKAGENRDLVMARAKRLALESGIAEDEALIQVYENMTSLGLTPEDAAAGQARLEREFASDPMWMELVDRLRAMNRRTLEIRREAGLITEETYRKLVARYPNFVPVVRSIYDNDVDVDGTTYMPKNIKKRAVRTMISGQLVEESKLRTFWGASLAITQLDRNAAINQAARNSADNVLFLLSNQVDLETGEPIVGVDEDGETIGLQARSGKPLLEPLYVDEEVRKVITLATVRAKTPRREDESPEEYRQRIEREVAFAQGQAMADMRTKLDKEASGEKPTLRRFKLDRDLDLTPREVYEEAEQIMSSPDGLSDRERAENAKLEKRIAEEKARLASPEFAARVAEIDREIKSLEASRRPGVDSTGIDARIDMLKKEKLLPKRRINSARSRMVQARDAEQREEARNSLLERKRRFYAKGEVMYYRINEPTLAQAMLVMRKTPLERMAESPLAIARGIAKGWFGVMSMMRFAYVQASLGFLVGEMQRSPQQATIMARILAAEYDLDAETSDKFIRGLAGKVGGGAYFMPKTAVFGAIKAMPFNKASRSIYRIMRGETPSNDYERMVRQAIEDGVLQGQLYSVDSFELARKRVVADLKRLETGDASGILGNAKKATRKVGEVLDLTLTAIDLVNRMHVYTAAVEAGISRQTATVMARESLVDFAKKGTAARGIGQVLLFFSPRMQGIHQLTRSFSMLRATGARLAVRALAAKFLWSFVSSMARELFYEDDEDASTMISKFAAERNLIVPAWKDSETGEWKWVQIAEPYGFGAVSRAGTAVADMLV
ncbi:MAG: hypothetical protein ACO3SJ_01165, partial [Phycisphaerales bacterium]